MKKIISLGVLLAIVLCTRAQSKQAKVNLYDLDLTFLDGKELDLKAFKGRKILFVNVASKCGFTPQYEGLQKLQEKFKDKLVVIGVPCNQFGGQEPGSPSEIQNFCQKNYGVDFIITEKIKVKGDGQHPLYQFLTKKEFNGVANSSVRWNFQKFLVDENGSLLKGFSSGTKPMSADILDLL